MWDFCDRKGQKHLTRPIFRVFFCPILIKLLALDSRGNTGYLKKHVASVSEMLDELRKGGGLT